MRQSKQSKRIKPQIKNDMLQLYIKIKDFEADPLWLCNAPSVSWCLKSIFSRLSSFVYIKGLLMEMHEIFHEPFDHFGFSFFAEICSILQFLKTISRDIQI